MTTQPTPKQILESYGIPTTSYVKAIGYIKERADLNKEEYEYRYNELVSDHAPLEFASTIHAKFHYLYLVQELIRAEFPTDTLSTIEDIVYVRVHDLETVHPEFFQDYSTSTTFGESKVDATGQPKQKKGAKKQHAIELWNDTIKDSGMSRQDAIKLLMDEVGLSQGGASTYFQNLKSGKYY